MPHAWADLVTRTTDRDTDTGETTPDTLAFRDQGALRSDLAATGFEVEDILGDRDASPVRPNSRELIVIARR